jgi:hypothetical protein
VCVRVEEWECVCVKRGVCVRMVGRGYVCVRICVGACVCEYVCACGGGSVLCMCVYVYTSINLYVYVSGYMYDSSLVLRDRDNY